MKSIGFTLRRTELLQALTALSVTRRRRFRSIVPVRIRYDAESRKAEIVEERGTASASVRAAGRWPPTGATVDLYPIKRSLERHDDDVVELLLTSDAVLLSGDCWHARPKLLKFGPESIVPDPIENTPSNTTDRGYQLGDLPLFRWAARRR